MGRIRNLSLLCILCFLAAACQPATPPVPVTPGATPTLVVTEAPTLLPPTETAPPDATPTTIPTEPSTPEPSPTPANTNTPEATATGTATSAPESPEEAILILEPGPGSRVTGPIRVAGIADPTFEQNLVVRIVQADGTEVILAPTTIQSEAGERGPFEIEMPVDLTEEQNIFIQVYATSARDGGVTHLAATGVIFTPGGPEDIVIRDPQPEQITIFQPALTDTISGGVAHVEGFGLASFEQTLLVEVLDVDGNVIGSEPVIVEAPDLGFPGPFSADIEYSVTESGPGRIVVRDVSPAFGGDTHLSSVEVTLEP